jgi:hypothetical protein
VQRRRSFRHLNREFWIVTRHWPASPTR